MALQHTPDRHHMVSIQQRVTHTCFEIRPTWFQILAVLPLCDLMTSTLLSLCFLIWRVGITIVPQMCDWGENPAQLSSAQHSLGLRYKEAITIQPWPHLLSPPITSLPSSTKATLTSSVFLQHTRHTRSSGPLFIIPNHITCTPWHFSFLLSNPFYLSLLFRVRLHWLRPPVWSPLYDYKKLPSIPSLLGFFLNHKWLLNILSFSALVEVILYIYIYEI